MERLTSYNEATRKVVQKCLRFPLDFATYRWAASRWHSCHVCTINHVSLPTVHVRLSRNYAPSTPRCRIWPLHPQSECVKVMLHNVVGSTKEIINRIVVRDMATGEAIGLA